MNIRTIMRGLTVASASVAALCLQTGSASATPPFVIPPPGEYTLHVPAEGVPCGALTIDAVDGSHTTVFFDREGNVRMVSVNGPLTVHITSDETHRSIDLNVSGPVKILSNGDLVLTGAMLLFGPQTLAVVHGRAYIPGGDLDVAEITGTRVDLCPILVG